MSSKNKEVTAVTKALSAALSAYGVTLGHQQVQHVMAQMLGDKDFHVLSKRLKRAGSGMPNSTATQPEPNLAPEGMHGILIQVDSDYQPEDEDDDAFDAVRSALEHFEIPTQMLEGTFYRKSPSQPAKEEVPIGQQRRKAADLEFESFEFGEGITVEDTGGWEDIGNDALKRVVFVSLADRPAGSPTEKVVFTVGFAKDSAEVLDCVATLHGKLAGRRPAQVGARFYTDDRAFETEFDAAAWVKQASDDEVLALARIQWGGDAESDEVGRFFEDRIPGIGVALSYCRRTESVGFEVYVNADEAMAWLKRHRNGLWARILCESNEVRLVEAQEDEIRGMWDWLGPNGNACDHSFDTIEDAALNAVAVLALT